MAQIISASQSSSGADLFNVSTAAEGFLVLPGVQLTTVGHSVFETTSGASDFALTLMGVAAAMDAPAVAALGARASISLTADASLIMLSASGAALHLAGNDAALSNMGSLTAVGSYAVWAQGARATLVNHGDITGHRAAVISDGAGSVLINHGSITGLSTLAATPAYGLHLRMAAQRLVNHGTITASGPGGAAAVHVTSPSLRVDNHGTLVVAEGWALGAAQGSSTTLRNHGLISGTDPAGGALQLDDMANSVINRGTILGTVDLGAGDDTIDSRQGVIDGDILGGDGNDTFFVSTHEISILEFAGGGIDTILSAVDFDLGVFDGIERLELRVTARQAIGSDRGETIVGNAGHNRLEGLGGTDLLQGGAGNDTLDGGMDADTLEGGSGDDSLLGDNGYDSLFGGAGNDTLRAGVGNDRAEGGDGDDLVLGDGGLDRVYGGVGADTLAGGAGRDSLYGGADGDVFLFQTPTETAPGSANRDTIFDFEAGLDRIDLAAIDADSTANGNQAFGWSGNAAFTAQAGQVRWQVSGANVILSGDVTGDGQADFEIVLTGQSSLSVNDLLL